jgi:hypothetical protein
MLSSALERNAVESPVTAAVYYTEESLPDSEVHVLVRRTENHMRAHAAAIVPTYLPTYLPTYIHTYLPKYAVITSLHVEPHA